MFVCLHVHMYCMYVYYMISTYIGFRVWEEETMHTSTRDERTLAGSKRHE